MPAAVKLREDYSAAELRRLAKRSKDANQSRRLLSLAAVREGKDRAEAAKLGGMDRQTLRDWVHRFNAEGPQGLLDHLSEGPKPRLTQAQLAELAQIVETGPDPKTDGVVRWRRIDLKAVIARRFGVAYHERSVGKLLKALGFSHISARPRHPKQDERGYGDSALNRNTTTLHSRLYPLPRNAPRRRALAEPVFPNRCGCQGSPAATAARRRA